MNNFEEPTEEKIAEYEAKLDKYYDSKLPFLRKKAEHDVLQADIAEARIRTIAANNQFAQAMAEQAKASKSKEEEGKKSE